MNTNHFACNLIAATALLFNDAAFAQDTPDSISVDCHTMQRPNQREVSRVLDISNFTQAYAAREKVMQIARQKCLRGGDRVEIAKIAKILRNELENARKLAAQTAPVH